MQTQLKKFFLAACFSLIYLISTPAYSWQSDNGDGTFTNPVLYADYPDPDIIRVGSDFYMVSTTFCDSPGINVLKSKDMVNWDLISHAASELNMSSDYDMKDGSTAYRQGMWACSIRYYKGTFYIVVNPVDSNARIYYSSDPSGPWKYHQLNRSAYDPGFFIDDDGTGYIICDSHSQTLLTLNSDYSAIVSQQEDFLDTGGEGSHVIKRGDYYYLFSAVPFQWPFELRVSRAKDIHGPWEKGYVAMLGTTGGHQGAVVEIDDNDNWYGFVHQDSGAIGRMPRIAPVFWENDWPVFGTPENRDVIADTYPKPVLGSPIKQPPTSDDFDSSDLGLQWQWNHNPDKTRFSLTERPGWLRLKASQSDSFWTARNTLTQKSQGPWCIGQVKLDLTSLKPGDICGFGTFGKFSSHISITCGHDNKLSIQMNVLEDTEDGIVSRSSVPAKPLDAKIIMLRTHMDFKTNKGICLYSLDEKKWTQMGQEFPLEFDWQTGTFQGEKFAIFCYNPDPSNGFVDVDSFEFSD